MLSLLKLQADSWELFFSYEIIKYYLEIMLIYADSAVIIEKYSFVVELKYVTDNNTKALI